MLYSLLPPASLKVIGERVEQLAPQTHPPAVLYVLAISLCCDGIFWMLQQMIFECWNRVIHVLQKENSNVGICFSPNVATYDFNC